MSRDRWISSTSGRSLGRLFVLIGIRARDPASCKSRASGRTERSISSPSISSEDIEESDPAEDLRRRLAERPDGFAHSGTGCSLSNCLCKRVVYSLPLTRSSSSLTRSFRSRELPASDTVNRSSSLSSQTGASPAGPPNLFDEGMRAPESIADGPESRKNNCPSI